MAKRSKAGNATLAVAYLRCSTTVERQALGIQAQRHAVSEWASKAGVTIVAWYTEEVSGGAPLDRRPVLLEALAAVAAHGAGQLVVHRLDRFSRYPLTAALAEVELRRHGAALACADGVGQGDDPASELVRGILVAVHRFDRAMIGARIRTALAVKTRAGTRLGTVPYGMRAESDGVLIPHAGEQDVIAMARDLRASGLTLRDVASELGRRGVVGRTGRPLATQQVHRILTAASSAPVAA